MCTRPEESIPAGSYVAEGGLRARAEQGTALMAVPEAVAPMRMVVPATTVMQLLGMGVVVTAHGASQACTSGRNPYCKYCILV